MTPALAPRLGPAVAHRVQAALGQTAEAFNEPPPPSLSTSPLRSTLVGRLNDVAV